jgi:hypothetical protein
MSKTVRLAPYPMSEALSLEFSEFDDPTTGNPVQVELIKPDPTLEFLEQAPLAYDASGSPWTKLGFRVSATLPVSELEDITPAGTDIKRDLQLIVSVTCPSTKYRHAVMLSPKGPGRWLGAFSLQRRDVKNQVLFRPLLVRRTALPASSNSHHAQRAAAIIAQGLARPIHVDPAIRDLRALVDVEWEDFAKSGNEWRRGHHTDLYHLELYADRPKLYLNSVNPQMRTLLESKQRTGVDAALRELLATVVAQSTWLPLAVAALAAIDYDETEGIATAPSSIWMDALLRVYLPQLYPHLSDDSQLREAAEDMKDPSSMQSLLGKLGSIVQGSTEAYRAAELALRAREQEAILEEASA